MRQSKPFDDTKHSPARTINLSGHVGAGASVNILITGASGFIGQQVAHCLAAGGHRLTLLGASREPALPQVDGPGADMATGAAVGPLEETDDLDRWMKGIDTVIHAAGLAHVTDSSGRNDVEAFRKANVDATVAVCNAMRRAGVGRLIMLSSIAAKLLEGEYGRSKLAAEEAAKESLPEGAEYVFLRPPMVYGPGSPGNLKKLIRLIGMRIPLPFGSITGKRSLCSAANLAEAIERIVTAPSIGRATYEICDDERVTLAEITRALGGGMGVTPLLVPFPPKLLAFLLGIVAPGLPNSLLESVTLDAGPLKQAFDWSPGVTTQAGLYEVGRQRDGGTE